MWNQAQLALFTFSKEERSEKLTWPDTVHGSASEACLDLYLNLRTKQ